MNIKLTDYKAEARFVIDTGKHKIPFIISEDWGVGEDMGDNLAIAAGGVEIGITKYPIIFKRLGEKKHKYIISKAIEEFNKEMGCSNFDLFKVGIPLNPQRASEILYDYVMWSTKVWKKKLQTKGVKSMQNKESKAKSTVKSSKPVQRSTK